MANLSSFFFLFYQTKNFKIALTHDYHTVEMCGALKNIVAFAAGMVDGLGYKHNTKASVVRLGLLEMIDYIRLEYPESTKSETFFESAGIADLVCSSSRLHSKRAVKTLHSFR